MKNRITIFAVFVFSVFIHHTAYGNSSIESMNELGRQFTSGLNTADESLLRNLFDMDSFAQRAADYITDDPQQKQQYQNGFKVSINTVVNRLVSDLNRQEGHARFLRSQEFFGVTGPLVRYDSELGYNYFVLMPNADGKIQDLYILTNGEWLSKSLGAVSQLLVAPNKTILGRLFGQIEYNDDVVNQLRKIGQHAQIGEIREAYAIIREFPPELRNQREMINLAVQFAIQINDNVYRQELNRLATHYRDHPSASFLLIDHYYFKEEFDSALAIVDNMESIFGLDGAIATLKSSVEIERGNYEKAFTYASQGVELEPDNEDMYWTLTTTAMLSENFEAGVSALTTLENNFDYLFEASNFEGEEIYEAFTKSKAFSDWMNSR